MSVSARRNGLGCAPGKLRSAVRSTRCRTVDSGAAQAMQTSRPARAVMGESSPVWATHAPSTYHRRILGRWRAAADPGCAGRTHNRLWSCAEGCATSAGLARQARRANGRAVQRVRLRRRLMHDLSTRRVPEIPYALLPGSPCRHGLQCRPPARPEPGPGLVSRATSPGRQTTRCRDWPPSRCW